ncbi:E3 ubiquitin-protein ligase TRIM35-like [Danio aesculapii]|uniref:E3 ubiquitin-protein ligase TRIM35-like n=1 Tax=Danio aesculapii TaxID=1142201 RepID=UPI0024BF9FD8|nr:E3 ubiquitin-protein ligase TRIM35-like [Danio aesculapii]
MASLHVSAEEISCPVCCEIFKDPVILSCSHSFCRECLQQFWRTKGTRECPVCRRRSSRDDPPNNLVLRNLCESFHKERKERPEEICSLHGEKLKLFCLEDKQLVCLVCITSQQHDNHKFRPIGELVPAYKEELNTALKTTRKKCKQNEEMRVEFEKTVQHITDQADDTEHQIKQQFEKLHQFLRDEEEATITALRKEEKQKKQMMKEKLEEINTHISALSHIISDTEEMLKANDVCFLKEFPGLMERVQISQPDPQMPSGALIHVSQYLGNLQDKVWRKMQDIVHYTPVILDPNTAHPSVILSDNLISMRETEDERLFPDNPERFGWFPCVVGSEGFSSGKHSWDVEVKESRCWSVGVTTASNQRKGKVFFNTDVWSVRYQEDEQNLKEEEDVEDGEDDKDDKDEGGDDEDDDEDDKDGGGDDEDDDVNDKDDGDDEDDGDNDDDAAEDSQHPNVSNWFDIEQKLECVRVELDYDRGTVCFSDPLTDTHLHTFTAAFTDTVFPFFSSRDRLKILPVKVFTCNSGPCVIM